MAQRDYARLSLWLDSLRDDLTPRPALDGDADADVAIVGAGYTGLWTAYYLLRAQPDMRVTLVEKEIAGFGASGRNGGWCSGLFAAPRTKVARRHGRTAAIALERALFDTVDEVGRIAAEEGIDADFVKGGTLTAVTSPAQTQRVRAMLEEDRAWGFGEADFRWVDARELTGRIRIEGALGARFTPHCARIHPARLARGLARAVERLGGRIYERTEAESITPRRVATRRGNVTADFVVRATEGYTPQLPRMRRALLPLYSLMVATAPLDEATWKAIGWDGYETLHDGRHLLVYAQRTADDRIAIGGRGAPYHYGSRVAEEYDSDESVFDALKREVGRLFPAARGAAFTHEWGGCLGVPRDWFSSVGLDRASGIAWASGYGGDGVSTSNLAGRTIRDLVLDADSDLVRLPWVHHRSRRWEPEPLRWLGVNAGLKALAHADRVEERTGRPTRRGKLVRRLIGL